MKIKIFYLIFLLKFVFYSCTSVLYYSELIKKYSNEVTLDPQSYQVVGFILDISAFKENEENILKFHYMKMMLEMISII